MELYHDFKELLELFNAQKIEYINCGRLCAGISWSSTYTGDIDILIRPNSENARRVLTALDEFGFGSVGLTEEDFKILDKVVQLGVPPVRVDFMTSITGVATDDVFSRCVKGKYGDIPVKYIGRDEFILNKRATGRKRICQIWKLLGKNNKMVRQIRIMQAAFCISFKWPRFCR